VVRYPAIVAAAAALHARSFLILYKRLLGVLFYKPHPWTRAYRVEAHLEQLESRDWLMPLLAAIKAHTEVSRHTVEPFPQFMADERTRCAHWSSHA
jgi:hypothetical protein